MKYKNAQDILPDELLNELQKYASGVTIYIPAKEKQRKSWGARSGAREFYRQRNDEIRRKFFESKTDLYDLADEYHLSVETIRKIVYR